MSCPPLAAMRWLVDGMNVIGSRPTGWWRDRRGAMRELVERLDAFARSTGDDVAVVLDGAPFALSAEHAEVAFASRRGRDAADDDIAARAEAGMTVVTSDRELARRSVERGAQVVGAGEFLRRLDDVTT
ncbi:MAG TPA: NYN domain-containing protein [Solirubrobacteraceae bacterium]